METLTFNIITASFSILSIIISAIALSVSLTKLKFEKRKILEQTEQGLRKLNELVLLIRDMQNINPNEMSMSKFSHDKVLFEKFLSFYDLNEGLISTVNPIVPRLISNINKFLIEIDELYKKQNTYTNPKDSLPLLSKYEALFENLIYLTSILDKANYSSTSNDRGFEYYKKLQMDYFLVATYIKLSGYNRDELVNKMKETINNIK